MAVNIKPLIDAAAMIGSTIWTMLRMVFLLFAFANTIRKCNISVLVENASAKAGTGVAFFASFALFLTEGRRKPASMLDSGRPVPQCNRNTILHGEAQDGV